MIRVVAGFTIFMGVLALMTWVFNFQVLQKFFTRNIIMPANSGFIFILAGVSLLISRGRSKRFFSWNQGIGLLIAAIGILTFGEYLFGWNLAIDRLLYPDENFSDLSLYPERMAPLSALNFLMLGTVLIFRKRRGSNLLIMAMGLISLLSLLGYLYEGVPFFSLLIFKKMSLSATVTFLVLAVGLLLESAAANDSSLVLSDSAAGVMLRKLLPSAFLVPIVLGWLRLEGEVSGFYNTGFGVSLTALMNVIILSLLIYWTGHSIHQVDSQRREALDSLKKAHDELEGRVAERTAELRQLTAHLQTVREDERIRISREIHDELGQELTGLKMDLSWISKKVPSTVQPKIESMSSLVDHTIQTVRKISQELRPGVLDTLGLDAALEWQAQEFQKRTGIMCHYFSSLDGAVVDREVSTAVFRICQELLTNVARHAEARKVQIDLNWTNHQLILEVNDNGKGISSGQVVDSKAWGLIGMRERAHLMKGELEIEGHPGKGTTVKLVLPLEKS